METQLSTIRDFSEVSWDEQTKPWSSYVWVHFILIRCFIAVETCKWLKQPEIGMCMLSLKVQKCDMLQKQKVANFASLCQISNNLTRVPEHDISNFDALGKGKLPQTHVFPEMSILGVEYVCTIVPAPAPQWADKLWRNDTGKQKRA